jgi:hypothetical protein
MSRCHTDSLRKWAPRLTAIEIDPSLAVLGEALRVLRPGGVFAGSDSTSSFVFRLAHLLDTMVLVDPDSFSARLEAAGFANTEVHRVDGAFRWRATRPIAVLEPGAC